MRKTKTISIPYTRFNDVQTKARSVFSSKYYLRNTLHFHCLRLHLCVPKIAMKKTFLLFTLLILTVGSREASAQTSFNHSVGAFYARTSQYSISYRIDNQRYENQGHLAGIGLVYAPRVNLFEIGYNSSFSVSTRLGAGFGFGLHDGPVGVDTVTNSTGSSNFMIDVPILFDFNHGTVSVYDNANPFGWFVGIGAGYNRMGQGKDIKFYTGSYGPMVNGGIRFNVAEKYMEVRSSYMLDINQAELSVFTLGLSYYLGMNMDY